MMPPRVAYVLKVFPKVSETFIIGELAELRRRGVDLRVLSLARPTESFQHRSVAASGLDPRVIYDSTAFLGTLREFAPDVMHAHFATEATAAARDLARAIGRPFTLTAHGYDVYRRPPADFAARAAAAAMVITVSDANARHIETTFGVPRSHLRVIPCGVDTRRFQPGAPRADPPLILCVARLVPVKNHTLLLEACAMLRARGVRFQCVLVGDGREREAVAGAIRRLGLASVVEMVGAVDHDDVRWWWPRASVGVLTSESEGMPVCLMEAGACGVPVVATAVGGVRELVADGVTGLLAESGDAVGVADRLERLITDRALAERMGGAARRRIETRFSVGKQVDGLLAVWRVVVPERAVV